VLGWVSGFEIGAGLGAIVVEHRDAVAVYAEVARDAGSPGPGALISSGQRLATGAKNSSGNSMLHFELWRTDAAPKAFVPWWIKDPPPRGLLDPTEMLLALAARG
jgi:hypothetical protein